MQKFVAQFALFSLMFGCSSEGLISTQGDLDQYAGATLLVHSPLSASVFEIGETMAKVRWHDEDIVEWMPFYSLEIVDV